MQADEVHLIRQAITLARNGDVRGAMELAGRACELAPESVQARLFAGELHMRIQRLDTALSYYREAAELAPADPRIRLNIGIVLKRLGRDEEAEAAYREAVATGPEDPSANQALGMTLFQRGQLAEARGHLAVARAGGAADPYNAYAFVLFALDDIASLRAPPAEIDPGQRLGEATLPAIVDWIQGDTEACAPRTALARDLLDQVEKAPNRDVWRHYVNLLTGLLAWRRDNAAVYVSDGAPEPLYVVGDSHCLTTANLVAPVGGVNRRLATRLVFGCKAWHLTGPGENNYKAAFETVACAIPERADVAFCLGELDCRYTTGVLAHVRRHLEVDADEEIDRLARAYGEWVLARAAARSWRPFFITFPKSHVREGLIPDANRALFDRIRDAFPAIVREVTAAAGAPVIDLYRVTEGNAALHIDQNHVSPQAVLDALA